MKKFLILFLLRHFLPVRQLLSVLKHTHLMRVPMNRRHSCVSIIISQQQETVISLVNVFDCACVYYHSVHISVCVCIKLYAQTIFYCSERESVG